MTDEPEAAEPGSAAGAGRSEEAPDTALTAAGKDAAEQDGAERSGNAAEDGKHPPPLRARFLDTLPDDPALASLAEAFEAGNYARVRDEAPRLAVESEREDVRAAARELLTRIEPDPLMKYLLVLALLLLLGVTAFAYGSGHG